jgi:hypothetical protein
LLVFVVGLATRLAPRYWTPLPFNPDGFRFASQAEQTLADGRLAVDAIGPQGYAFPTLLSQLELVVDVPVLSLTQPTIAVVGTIPCLLAFAITRRIARGRDWSRHRTLAAATTAGLMLAIEGLYLRRTAAVSYEVLGILLVVVSAYALHRLLNSRQWPWLWLLGPCLIILPVTHHLSTMMAALALTALVVVHVHQSPDRATMARAVPIAALFWVYLGSYYLRDQPAEFDALVAKPGLFVACVVALGGLALFLQTASTRLRRLVFALFFGFGFSMLALNAVIEIFPATSATHPRLLLHVAPLGVFALFALWAFPVGIDSPSVGPVVLALFLGPLVFVLFGLTAGLSPVYRSFVVRGQTFLHLSVVVVAAIAAVDLGWRVRARPGLQVSLRAVLPAVLLACAVVSLPLAFLGLPALPYESTTTSGEFQAVTFADDHLETEWTSDDHLTRIARNYYDADSSPGPTYEWLRGGTPPDCPVVVRDSWSSVGAQAFPSDPILAEAGAVERFVTGRLTVYAGGGQIEQTIVRSGDQTGACR